MTRPPDGTTAPPGGRWLYPVLLAMQTVGTAIVFWNGVPLYEQLARDPALYPQRPETLIWALSAVVLVQAGFWTRKLVGPPLPAIRNMVLAHVVKFVARIPFMLATAVFGFVFFTQRLAPDMPVSRYVLVMLVLHSLYCYMLELTRLGNALEGDTKPAGR